MGGLDLPCGLYSLKTSRVWFLLNVKLRLLWLRKSLEFTLQSAFHCNFIKTFLKKRKNCEPRLFYFPLFIVFDEILKSFQISLNYTSTGRLLPLSGTSYCISIKKIFPEKSNVDNRMITYFLLLKCISINSFSENQIIRN